MTTPKLYTATKAVVGSRQHILKLDPDWDLYFRDVITDERIHCALLKDLTEVTVVPKNAVVIEGRASDSLSNLISEVEKHIRLGLPIGIIGKNSFVADWVKDISTQLAQLAPPRPEERKELTAVKDWLMKTFPCTCADDYGHRNLIDPDCRALQHKADSCNTLNDSAEELLSILSEWKVGEEKCTCAEVYLNGKRVHYCDSKIRKGGK